MKHRDLSKSKDKTLRNNNWPAFESFKIRGYFANCVGVWRVVFRPDTGINTQISTLWKGTVICTSNCFIRLLLVIIFKC